MTTCFFFRSYSLLHTECGIAGVSYVSIDVAWANNLLLLPNIR
jgi:hypothetical protein